jgi:hypothetical protein
VIVLPSYSSRGELTIRHSGREATLDLRPDDAGEAAFAAFYAECVHQVLPVAAGCRLALIYNLLRRQQKGALLPPDYRNEQARIERRLRDWRSGKPEKLVYPLQHAYTPAQIALNALKGADAGAAEVLAAAAVGAECELHLALLTIEESGIAEYGTMPRVACDLWHGYRPDPGAATLMPRHDPSLAPLLTSRPFASAGAHPRSAAPPTDWRRASAVKCTCGDCRQLAAFLDAPGQRVWVLRAPEQVRAHVEDTLRRACADVDAVTERRTKNQASYERRAAQRAQDLADFKLLDF